MAHPAFELIKSIVESSGLMAPREPDDELTVQDQVLMWREALERFATDATVPQGVSLTPLRIGNLAVDLLTPGNHANFLGAQPNNDEFPSLDLVGPIVVYLHGGGFCAGSRSTHRDIACRLALSVNLPVMVVDYPLAPESPYPQAAETVCGFIEHLYGHGVHPDQVILAGDSAGGGLCITTMMMLRDQEVPLPRGAVVISPWVDLTLSDPRSVELDGADPLIGMYALEALASVYVATSQRDDPYVSPLFGDLSGLPPVEIHVGDREVLYPDALRLHDRLKDHGVSSDLHVYLELTHVFQLMPPEIVPESGESFERARTFIHTLLSESETS